MAYSLGRVIASLAAGLLLALSRIPAPAAHPLDPLSSDEIRAAVAVLREAGLVDDATRFPLIDLAEPDKAEVMVWQPGQPEFRTAFVVARRERAVYEAVVDLAAGRVKTLRQIPHVQSGILSEESADAQRITLADPGWQTAMRNRGYRTFDGVFCGPLSAGPATDPSERQRRLLRVACFDAAGADTSFWSRPIEGLIAVVDLDAAKVIKLVDTGPVPANRQDIGLGEVSHAGEASPVKPALAAAAAGHEFTIDGSNVRWSNWSFHFRMDRRSGVIVSLVRYADQGRERMVLYRGSLAEMFVPYMDAGPTWGFRAFMDEGEWGLGLLSSPLKPGIDCPADATFIDAVLPDDRGRPLVGKSVICLFERSTGAPLWRHSETANGAYSGCAAVELVLRTIASLGNYDYVIDWVLTEAGAIRIEVGATGIDAVKKVQARDMRAPSAAVDTASGDFVAANLIGINHDHFLSFRLDVDIDGAANTLIRRKLVRERMAGDFGRRSLWRVADERVGSEGPLDENGHGGANVWWIVNPNSTNSLGQHPGYELRPEHSATSLLGPDDIAQRRARFSAAPLWVTAYDRSELYAAGDYPNQSEREDGLPAYVAQHRPVENADIVLWYTMGFHHLPRPEDWPVLPTIWHAVSLVPYGFFDRNPAFGVPGEPATGRAAPKPENRCIELKNPP